MPLLRHVSASAFTFSTTFCSFACSGEPESGEGAAVDHHVVLQVLDDQHAAIGSRVRPSSFIYRLLTHVRLAAGADDRRMAYSEVELGM